MRQCKLRKGNSELTSWIDVNKSDVGKFVEVEINDKLQQWEILEVYDPYRTKEECSDRTQDHKNMRKVTDI